MPIGSIAAVAIGICLPLYSQVQTVTIGFPEGSVEISEGAYWHIAEAAGLMVGNELAELHLDAYFPYGAGREDEPAMSLARARTEAVRRTAVQLGVASELVDEGQSALGWDIDAAGQTRPVPFPAEQLNVVEMRIRVKADCHPLAEEARRTNPNR